MDYITYIVSLDYAPWRDVNAMNHDVEYHAQS